MADEKKSERKRQNLEDTKETERITSIVQEDLQRRNASTSFFRNSDLLTYAQTGRAQFIGHRAKPEWKKDYQYNVFDPITRDQVMAIISKSAGLYEAQFFNTNKRLARVSEIISVVLGAFYRDSTRQMNETEKNRQIMLSALITPKAIWYEGWKHQKRKIQDIQERDEFGKITKTEPREVVYFSGPWGEVVPVEDFIPGSLRIRDMQEQPRVSWIPKMQMEEFKRRFPEKMYPAAKFVEPYGRLFEDGLSELTIRNDLKESEVEVLMFFEKWEDRLSIIANGIILTKKNNPMPYAHKDFPFVWGGFEELDPHFVYDMPLTMKLLDMQDVDNEVLNLTLDMIWRALNEIVLVGQGDEINDDTLYGGGMVAVNDAKNFQKLEFGSSFAFNAASGMMGRVRQSIESSSLDAPLRGQSGSRQITAREALIAKEAALEITSLFLQNMEAMERGKAILRVKNQLDRYRLPIDWEKRIGGQLAEEGAAVFREISARDVALARGRRGTANVVITEKPLPKEKLDMANLENDKELTQTIHISPELIREIEFDVEIIANSSVKKSKELEEEKSRADLGDAIKIPNVLNVPYFAREFVKTRGKNPDEALVGTAPGNPFEEAMKKISGLSGQNGKSADGGDMGNLGELINA